MMDTLEVLDALEKLYKKDNYYTIQKIHNEFIVGITPFNGHMVYGRGKTVPEAYEDFLIKRKKEGKK